MIVLPTPVESERARQEARRAFQKHLASWASDALALRARGLRGATRREAAGAFRVRRAA